MQQIAEEVLAATGSTAGSFIGWPVDDPSVRRPDTELARTVLGWEPRITRNRGPRETVTWYEGELHPPGNRDNRPCWRCIPLHYPGSIGSVIECRARVSHFDGVFRYRGPLAPGTSHKGCECWCLTHLGARRLHH